MRFQLDRNTIVLVIFIIIIAAIFGANRLVNLQPPLELTVVVDPIAEDWLEASAQAYNEQNKIINGTVPVKVNIQIMDDLDVWRGTSGWNTNNHPHVWIPSSSVSLDYVPSSLTFDTINESIAFTPLVWGGFQNRAGVITNDGATTFDWQSVQAVSSETRWSDGSFVNMAINWPSGSMAGVAALGTSVASFSDTATISTSEINSAEFATWFNPLRDSMLNSERLSGNPAQVMATRGTSAADFALLPESQWLTELVTLNSSNTVVFAYPEYQFVLDFPLTMWRDAQTTANETAAVQNFANFLTGDGQAIALEYGFRPADMVLDESASLFSNGLGAGLLLEPPLENTVTLSNRSLAEQLIALVD